MAVAQLRIQRRLKEICIVVVRFLSSTHQVKTILIKTCLTSYFSLFRLFITSCMHTPHISSTHKQCKKGIILSAIATVSQSLDGILFRLHLFNQKTHHHHLHCMNPLVTRVIIQTHTTLLLLTGYVYAWQKKCIAGEVIYIKRRSSPHR